MQRIFSPCNENANNSFSCYFIWTTVYNIVNSHLDDGQNLYTERLTTIYKRKDPYFQLSSLFFFFFGTYISHIQYIRMCCCFSCRLDNRSVFFFFLFDILVWVALGQTEDTSRRTNEVVLSLIFSFDSFSLHFFFHNRIFKFSLVFSLFSHSVIFFVVFSFFLLIVNTAN